MTGSYLRVARDGAWEDVEIDRLTDEELRAWANHAAVDKPLDGFKWAIALAGWVRDRVKDGGLIRDLDVESAARVDVLVRHVDEGIRAMPDRSRGEARDALSAVILEAIGRARASAAAGPGPPDGGRRPSPEASTLPGPGRDGH